MSKHLSFQKIGILAVSSAALAAGAMAGLGNSNQADAATVTNARGGTFTLTFNGQTTAAQGKDGAKGGNVEFEWKVEEGESAIKPIDGLKAEMETSERKRGNIEYEWKVEEGES